MKIYRSRGFSKINVDALPELGVIIPDVCACFIYWDRTSKLCFYHGLITASYAKKRDILNGIKTMMEYARRELKLQGVKMIITYSKFNSLLSVCRKNNFLKNDQVTEMVTFL